MTAIFLQILGQMVRTDAALLIAWYCIVNEFRIGQIEVRHDFPELLQRALLDEPRVALLFLCNGGNAPILVVMGWIDECVVR